jgi:2-polyprenyl-3-methyl-5-hydroxy-6-metoxy-1,4-benzoquinol methylase
MEETRHKYEYDVNLESGSAPAHVIQMIGNNKRVLEIGPGPGSITKVLQGKSNCRVTALEYDEEAIKMAAPYCEVIKRADLNSSEWPHLLGDIEQFDVVVAADVLEHLYDPWAALRRMVPFINTQGYLIISLPHVGHAIVMSCLLNGDFEYRDCGLLDRTHIRFFGFKNMESLFAQANLKIIEARYVAILPEETEYAASWGRLSTAMQDALMNYPHAQVYQVVVKAVPLNYLGDPVSLVPPKYRYKRSIITSPTSLRTRIGRHLSASFKQRIRISLKMLGIHI